MTQSLNHALEVVELFFTCSGLRANFDKAQAVWIGARRGCGENFKQINPSSGIIPVHLSYWVFNILYINQTDI